jgi:hypothetical protein
MKTAKTESAKARKITKAERGNSELSQNKLRRDFNSDEIRTLAQSMAGHSVSIQEIEQEKSAIAAQYKSKIETAKSEMQEAANKLIAGFEIVNRECLVVFRPTKREKDLFDPATSEFISSEPMTEPDFQRELRLHKARTKPAAGQKGSAANPGEPDPAAEAAAAAKDKATPAGALGKKSQGQIADALGKAAAKKADAAAAKAAKN